MFKKQIVLSLCAASLLNASGWDDILSGAEIDRTLQDDGGQHTVSLYNATVTYTVNNLDGESGNLDGNDTANITVSAGGKTISSGLLTKDQLKVWAKENADTLLELTLGGDPASTLGGENSASLMTYNITNTILKADKKSGKKLDSRVGYNSKILMNSETSSIKDRDRDIDGSAGIFTYSKDFESGNSFGLMLSYRHTKADDDLDSETAGLAFVPFYKRHFTINDNFSVDGVVNLSANMVYLESSLFPDGAGYLEYGAGFGVVPQYEINEQFSINGNLGLQYLKKYIPSSVIPEDAEWLADAINDLKPLQTLNVGIGMQYDITPDWKVNLDALQLTQLENTDIESGRDKANYYTLTSTYEWTKWSLGLGFKTVENVKDYSEDTYMVSLKYKW